MVIARSLIGRSFSTTFDIDAAPVWTPLEDVARLARTSAELPSFHEGEFMYMGCVHNASKKLTIYLYKHYDTRRYLNLDDAGHAYAYRHVPSDVDDPRSGGHYRRFRSLPDALEAADLWIFDEVPTFIRSFPPDRWTDAHTDR